MTRRIGLNVEARKSQVLFLVLELTTFESKMKWESCQWRNDYLKVRTMRRKQGR